MFDLFGSTGKSNKRGHKQDDLFSLDIGVNPPKSKGMDNTISDLFDMSPKKQETFSFPGAKSHKVEMGLGDITDFSIMQNIPKATTRNITIPTFNRPRTTQLTRDQFLENRKRTRKLNQGFIQKQKRVDPSKSTKTIRELQNDSEIVAPKQLFTPENVASLPEVPGLYEFFDAKGNRIYVGVTERGLKHRVSSYYQTDDFKEHPTKAKLRPHIVSFRARAMPIEQARELEHKLKGDTKFNFG